MGRGRGILPSRASHSPNSQWPDPSISASGSHGGYSRISFCSTAPRCSLSNNQLCSANYCNNICIGTGLRQTRAEWAGENSHSLCFQELVVEAKPCRGETGYPTRKKINYICRGAVLGLRGIRIPWLVC